MKQRLKGLMALMLALAMTLTNVSVSQAYDNAANINYISVVWNTSDFNYDYDSYIYYIQYDGNSHKLMPYENGLNYSEGYESGCFTSDEYTLSCNEETNVGEYTSKITLNMNSSDLTGLDSGSISLFDQAAWSQGKAVISKKWSITPADVTVSWDNQIITYGEEIDRPKIYGLNNQDITDQYDSEDITFRWVDCNDSGNIGVGFPVNVGDYSVIGDVAPVGNYSDTTVTAYITIKKKDVTPIWDSVTKEIAYTGETFAHTASIANDIISGDAVYMEYGENPNGGPEGCTYAYNASAIGKYYSNITGLYGPDADNYKFAYMESGGISDEWQIKKGSMSTNVTAADVTVPYDGQKHNISVSAPTGATIKYKLDENAEYVDASEFNIKDVKIVNGQAAPYEVFYQVTKDNYETVEGSKKLTITPKEVSPVLTGSISKIYDGAKAIDLKSDMASNLSLSFDSEKAPLAGDDLTLDTTGANGTFFDKSVGNNIAVTVDGLNIKGADKNNYKLTASAVSANIGQITARTITPMFSEYVGKIYDGTTAGTFPEGKSINLDNTIQSDDVAIDTSTCTVTYEDANAGYGKQVTITGLILAGNDKDNYQLSDNKVVSNNGDIVAKTIVPVWDDTSTVAYDGTSHSHLVTIPDNQLIPSDIGKVKPIYQSTSSYSGNATFAETATDVGNYYNCISTSLGGSAGSNYYCSIDSSNYPNAEVLSGYICSEWKITEATLTVNAENQTFTYDGQPHNIKVTATDGATIKYKLEGDNEYVDASQLDLRNVCTNLDVYYQVTKPNYGTKTGSAKLTINKKDVTPVITGTATKVYDGDTSVTNSGKAALNVSFAANAAPIASDSISLNMSQADYTYNNKNAGNSKTVTVSGITLSGGNAVANYNLTTDTVTANGAITKRPLSAAYSGSITKEYDGTTAGNNATGANASQIVLYNKVMSENVSIANNVTFTYADANAGYSKNVTISGMTLTGTDASNYELESTTYTSSIGQIRAKVVVPVWDASTLSIVYDGAEHSHIATIPSSQIVASDIGKVALTFKANPNYSGNASFAESATNVGKYYNCFTFASLTGSAAGNYVIDTSAQYPNSNVMSGGIVSEWQITPGTMTVTAEDQTFTYDGQPHCIKVNAPEGATVKYRLDGNSEYVTASELNLVNACSNVEVFYQVSKPNYATVAGSKKLTINKKNITPLITGTVTKVYDSNVSVTDGQKSNLNITFDENAKPIASDNITIDTSKASYSYDNKNIGTSKTVTVAGIVLAGGNAVGNYNLTTDTLTATGVITACPITASYSGSITKIYDGTTAGNNANGANVSQISLNGQIGQDDVRIANTCTFTYADANVGEGKNVTISGLSLSGNEAGNYKLTSNTITGAFGKITPGTMTVTAEDQTFTYDGQQHCIKVTAPEGATVKYRLDGNSEYAAASELKLVKVCSNVEVFYQVTKANYTTVTGSKTLTINPKKLTAAISGETSKVIDGDVKADKGTIKVELEGVINGDDVTVDDSECTYAYDDANVGVNKTVTVDGIKLKGADVANYVLEVTKVSGNIGTISEVSATPTPSPTTEPTAAPTAKPTKAPDNAVDNNAMLSLMVKIAVTDGKVKLVWGKIKGADGYDIYIRDCDNKAFTKVTKSVSASTVSYSTDTVNGRKVSDKRAYKAIIKAYKKVKGKKVIIAKTICVHGVGADNAAYTNPKEIILKKTAITIRKGKKCLVNIKIRKQEKGKKLLDHEKIIRYISTNSKIAKVNSSGKIKALKKGRCKIYIKCLDGTKKVIKVKVIK